MRHERLVRRDLVTPIHTIYGHFEAIAYTETTTGDCHLVLRKGAWTDDDAVLVRVHSSTETGDILGTLLENRGGR